MATSRKPKFFFNKMHFCTLALPLVFFSLLFTKVVCVVFSSVLCFCVVKILDLDHKANSFPLFSTFFFCPHLSSLSLSISFLFPFCFFLLSFVFLFFVLLLPPHLVLPQTATSSPHRFVVVLSLRHCLVVLLFHRYFVIVHRCLVALLFHCYFVAPPRCPALLGQGTF